VDEDLVVTMEAEEAMKTLARMNDGDCALLYACACASGGYLRMSDAASLTGMDLHQLERGFSLLVVNKLCRPAGAPVREDQGYSVAELLASRKSDPAFRGVCDYMEQALGRPIRRGEIEVLYGVYDKLNMGADVMMLLINYCRRQERLSARFLEKTAYEWHDRGVANYQAASELLDEIDRRQSQYGRVLSLFGITNRAPSESEKKYIAAWLEMGHSDDLIRMAYDRTVLRTGKLTWRYLHRILEEWKNKGYKTRRQVEAAEGSLASQSPVPEKPKEESAAAYVADLFRRRLAAKEGEISRRYAELRVQSNAFAANEIAWRQLTLQHARAAIGSTAEAEDYEQRKAILQKERAEILASMDLPPDYLELKYDCPICQDHGYTSAGVCDCFRRELVKEELRRKERKAL
jgi:DnaD/phage-associated family protein